jgi:hypothetical protein
MLLFFVVVIGHRDGIVSHVKNSFFVAFPKVKLWLPTFDFDFSKELFHLCLYVCIEESKDIIEGKKKKSVVILSPKSDRKTVLSLNYYSN